jgi:excisionase family DNA binding protein
MKPPLTQFGMRENTASSRQHALRLAESSVPSTTESLPRRSHHNQPAPVLTSHGSEGGDSLSIKPVDTATGTERVDRAEALAAPATVTTANKLRHVFEPLIGCEEAAQLLGNIHVKTMQRYARRRMLPGYRLGGQWYFRASELDAWLRSRINSSCHPCRSNGEEK